MDPGQRNSASSPRKYKTYCCRQLFILLRICEASAGIRAGFCYEPWKIQTLLLLLLLSVVHSAKILLSFCWDPSRILLRALENTNLVVVVVHSIKILLGFCRSSAAIFDKQKKYWKTVF